MESERYVYILFKLGEKGYMEELLDGKVYLNTLEYFRNNSNEEIGDPYEGTTSIVNLGNGTAQCGSKSFEIKNIQITQYDDINKNIFCLYSLTDENVKHNMKNNLLKINTNIFNRFTKDNSTYCVVIKDCDEFIKRLKDTLIKKKLTYELSPVKYCDFKTYSGRVTPFIKYDKYSHQQELRIVVNYESNAPLILDIGSIRDIAELIPPNQEICCTFSEDSE